MEERKKLLIDLETSPFHLISNQQTSCHQTNILFEKNIDIAYFKANK